MAKVTECSDIVGVYVVEPEVHGDDRGRFLETYRREWFPGNEMVQGSRSDKEAGALVGLHFHRCQADYWYVPRGRARMVLHDLRVGSPNEGTTFVHEIGEHNDNGIYIPPGVAHGFSALSDVTLTYLVDGYYNPDDELGVAFDDPAMGIDWGVTSPVVSTRDRQNPRKADLDGSVRPVFSG